MAVAAGTLRTATLPPVVVAAAAQLAGVAIAALGALAAARWLGVAPAWGVMAWLAGVVAALGGWCLGLPRWWLPLQFFFVPALYGAQRLDLPPWVWGGAFLATLLLLGNSVRDRVPLYLSSRAVWRELERLLPDGGALRMVDLGAGLCGGLAWLAARHPRTVVAGVESSPLVWLAGRLRLTGRPNTRLRLGSLWSTPLAEYDLVYAFLSPVPMPRLWRKARREMRPGTLLVSNSFAVPGQTPDATIAVADRRGSMLYVWRM